MQGTSREVAGLVSWAMAARWAEVVAKERWKELESGLSLQAEGWSRAAGQDGKRAGGWVWS